MGLFCRVRPGNAVYLNPVLQDWLGLQSEMVGDENEFWRRLAAQAADPAQASRQVSKLREGNGEFALIQFPVRQDANTQLAIQVFSLAGQGGQESVSGGFVSRIALSAGQPADLVEVFDTFLMPARQLAAALQGNLQALSGNLQTWNPEVLDRFLGEARDDLRRLCHYLDLGLGYSKVVKQTSSFIQPVSLIALLEEVIREQGYTTVSLLEERPAEGEVILANIDPALVKIALQILLEEVVGRTPAGLQAGLRLTKRDQSAVIHLESPRMLPLPGLAADNLGRDAFEAHPELFLAQAILAAQGGILALQNRQADQGGGLMIEVVLPGAEQPQSPPINQEWRDWMRGSSGTVLLAEAQPEYQLRIRDGLRDLGYRVDLAVDGSTVLDLIQVRQPKLVILARNLPGMDGLLVTQGVRRWSAVPIIMISMRDSLEDLLYAYRLGVDDYLTKPFVVEELLAKVQVFLSRQDAAQGSIGPGVFQEGSIRIDHATRQVWVRGEPVQLTPIEYNLLVYLSGQGRQIVPYAQLLEHVWEGPEKGTRQGLFVHVRRLREKIEEDPKDPQIIGNKWGVGYVFNP